MDRIYREIIRYIDRLSPNEWFLVLAAVIVVGLYCLRGFGSRSKY